MFCGIHGIVQTFYSALVPKSIKDKLSLRERVYLVEKVNSTINAVVLGLAGTYLILFSNTFSEDLFYAFPYQLETALCVLIAYSTYDMITMIYTDEHLSMWVHHSISIIASLACLVFRVGTFWMSVFAITEIPAAVINLHWYYSLYEKVLGNSRNNSKSGFLVALGFLKLQSFIFFRIWVAPYSIAIPILRYGLYGYIDRLAELPSLASSMILLIPVTMGIINFSWTRAMTKKTWKEVAEWSSLSQIYT